MKKLFFIAIAAVALTSCGNKTNEAAEAIDSAAVVLDEAQNDSLSQVLDKVKAGAAQVQEAIAQDPELQTLVEKAAKGEISDAEKLTLWQKLKKIGGDVVLGEKTAAEGVDAAVSEVKNAGQEEVKDAAKKAADAAGVTKAANDVQQKAADVQQKAQETKQKVDDVKAAASSVKNAVNAFKK